jgi:CspA family cold shock protein
MATGTIKNTNDDRGFAFIKQDSRERDVFVHYSAFEAAQLPNPQVGDRLSYELKDGGNGRPQAVSIKSLN